MMREKIVSYADIVVASLLERLRDTFVSLAIPLCGHHVDIVIVILFL